MERLKGYPSSGVAGTSSQHHIIYSRTHVSRQLSSFQGVYRPWRRISAGDTLAYNLVFDDYYEGVSDLT